METSVLIERTEPSMKIPRGSWALFGRFQTSTRREVFARGTTLFAALGSRRSVSVSNQLCRGWVLLI